MTTKNFCTNDAIYLRFELNYYTEIVDLNKVQFLFWASDLDERVRVCVCANTNTHTHTHIHSGRDYDCYNSKNISNISKCNRTQMYSPRTTLDGLPLGEPHTNERDRDK